MNKMNSLNIEDFFAMLIAWGMNSESDLLLLNHWMT